MVFDVDSIKKSGKRDFKSAWMQTAKLIPAETGVNLEKGGGNTHPLHDLLQKSRSIFTSLGFNEVENPVFIGEDDVYKQYGPEAPVILDRVYYLAGLPRPDIGLSEERKKQVTEIVEDFNFKIFQGLLRKYRSGDIEGDDFLEVMTRALNITAQDAAQIIGLFPEFRQIKPIPSKQTLRSHMTGAWFPTLAALVDEEQPVKLFSIGMRYRREQKLDATHLRAHYGGSMVVMHEQMSLEAGKKLSTRILEQIGFKDIQYEKKMATSNYYAPGTEYEVYSGDIEIADIGMYSPVALANYDIPYHVFNLGFGLERILMVQEGYKDVRELLYPQFYSARDFTDGELAGEITVLMKPSTEEGKKIAESIRKTARENSTEKSPCSYTAYEGKLMEKNITVRITEKEDGAMLLGPAALNEIYVHEGSIYGLPEDAANLKQDVSQIKKDGEKPGIQIIDAVAEKLSAQLESEISGGEKSGTLSVKMVKTPTEANIRVSSTARKFITGNNKRIMVKGPVFATIEYDVH